MSTFTCACGCVVLKERFIELKLRDSDICLIRGKIWIISRINPRHANEVLLCRLVFARDNQKFQYAASHKMSFNDIWFTSTVAICDLSLSIEILYCNFVWWRTVCAVYDTFDVYEMWCNSNIDASIRNGII